MIKQVANVPVTCQICKGTAYGRESQSKTPQGILVECVWICSRCGGVTRRHSEMQKDPNAQSNNP